MQFAERYLETLNIIKSDPQGVKFLEHLTEEAKRLAEDIFRECNINFSQHEKTPGDFATVLTSQLEVELALAITQKYYPTRVRKDLYL